MVDLVFGDKDRVATVTLMGGPTLCDPMDCSPLGSSVQGIPQANNTGVGSHSLLWGIL